MGCATPFPLQTDAPAGGDSPRRTPQSSPRLPLAATKARELRVLTAKGRAGENPFFLGLGSLQKISLLQEHVRATHQTLPPVAQVPPGSAGSTEPSFLRGRASSPQLGLPPQGAPMLGKALQGVERLPREHLCPPPSSNLQLPSSPAPVSLPQLPEASTQAQHYPLSLSSPPQASLTPPVSRGVPGVAPSPCTAPVTTPSPRSSLPPQWFIGVGDGNPPSSRVEARGAVPGRHPRSQGPISSLTKAAMQYWRATGNPKLQYLRAARALLTAFPS